VSPPTPRTEASGPSGVKPSPISRKLEGSFAGLCQTQDRSATPIKPTANLMLRRYGRSPVLRGFYPFRHPLVRAGLSGRTPEPQSRVALDIPAWKAGLSLPTTLRQTVGGILTTRP